MSVSIEEPHLDIQNSEKKIPKSFLQEFDEAIINYAKSVIADTTQTTVEKLMYEIRRSKAIKKTINKMETETQYFDIINNKDDKEHYQVLNDELFVVNQLIIILRTTIPTTTCKK